MTDSPEDELARHVAADLPFESRLAMTIIKASPDEDVRKTRFHKLAFLSSHLTAEEKSLDAASYFFGPFSENLQDSVNSLKELGAINPDGKLSRFGRKVQAIAQRSEPKLEAAEQLVSILREVPDRQITSMVYDLFPEFTSKSVIKDVATKHREYEVAHTRTDPSGRTKVVLGNDVFIVRHE